MTALFSCANFPVGAQMFGFHIVLRLRTIYLVVVQLCFYTFSELLFWFKTVDFQTKTNPYRQRFEISHIPQAISRVWVLI